MEPCPNYPCPQTRLIEIASCLNALWWTLLLFLPVHLFQTNAAFGYLPHVGPEWKWGIGSLIVSGWQGVASLSGRPLWRWLGLCLSAALWSGVVACLAEGSRWSHHIPINTGCGVYGVSVLLVNVCALILAPYVLADLSIWAGRRKSSWLSRLFRKAHLPCPHPRKSGKPRP